MKTFNFITAAAMVTMFFTACQQNEPGLLNDSLMKSTAVINNPASQVFTSTINDLTQADIDGVLLMREEEKLARDVYDYFYAQYGLQLFDRISASEEQHTTTILSFIEYVGLTDPALEDAGVFTNPGIQALYDQLTAAGSDVQSALKTGAFIEEYDIADLDKLLDETKNADLIRIYSNLEKGSENHLRAFASNLSVYGVTYEPQILNADLYATILSSSNGKGNRGNKGNGTGNLGNGDGVCDSTGFLGNQFTNGGSAYGDGICDSTGIQSGGNPTAQGNQNGNGRKGNGR